MRVRLDAGLRAELVRPETLRILVKAPPGQALPLARALKAGLDRYGEPLGTYVTEPVPVPPSGALFTAGLSALQEPQLDGLAAALAAWAEPIGVDDDEAELSIAPHIGGRYLAFGRFAPAVRASLRLPPILAPAPGEPSRSGEALARIAADWLTPGDAPDAAELLFYAYQAEFPLAPGEVAGALAGALAPNPPAVVLRSDFATTVRVGAISGGRANVAPEAALSWAGADPSAAGLVAVMQEQRDLLRRHHAVLAWGQVAITPTARRLLESGWDPQSAPQHPELAPFPGVLAGVSIPAPGWYQVLSPGHLDRLGGAPAGAVDLGNGQVELTIGRPDQWLPGHPDGAAVRDEAAARLGRAILDADETETLYRATVMRLLKAHGQT